jgi:hypothetical protein
MKNYNYDDVQKAVNEVAASGLEDFLYQEPHSDRKKRSSRSCRSSRKDRSHRSNRKKSSSRSCRSHRKDRSHCFQPRQRKRYWHDGNMYMLKLD